MSIVPPTDGVEQSPFPALLHAGDSVSALMDSGDLIAPGLHQIFHPLLALIVVLMEDLLVGVL